MSETNASGDSSELEALFDSIAGGVVQSPVASAEASVVSSAGKSSVMQQVCEGGGATEDSDELQALFDSMAKTDSAQGEAGRAALADSGSDGWPAQGKVFNQVGQMVRQLHDTLGGVGFDKLIEKTVTVLPDAKDRLTYIANLTEQAACKVLNATDIANPLQDQLESEAAGLGQRWDHLYANKLSVEEFRSLAAETRQFLKNSVPKKALETKEQLLEIMMAQDFQDLTGQVIKKIVSVAQDMESQLMEVLIETMPGDKRTESVNSLLNGPVINASGRTDVVGSQQQVDDLLDSLGF